MYLCCWFSKPRVIRPQRHESIQLFVQEPSHCFVCDRLDIDTFTFHTCHHTICSNCTYIMYHREDNECPICKKKLIEQDYTRFKKQCKERLS